MDDDSQAMLNGDELPDILEENKESSPLH